MIVERDVPITASDGLVLRADVFRPNDQTPAPVIMAHGPYGKGVEYKTGYSTKWKWLLERHPDILPGSTLSYETWETVDPELWTAWGYVCIRVDCRGTGRTPGKLDVFSPREIRDFYDAIEWAGVQSWSNGKVGLLGISYYAISQWLVAQLQPPHLTAMIPWEGAADCYRDWLRHGGILFNGFTESWYARQVVSNQHGNPNGHDDPWLREKATGPTILSEEEREANRTDMCAEAAARPLDDEWYKERSVDWSKVKVPFLSSANWGGVGLHGRGNFAAFTEAASTQKWLEIHPGRHEEGFYLNEGMALQRRFFDHFLMGVDNGWDQAPPVMFEMRRPEEPYSGDATEIAWPFPNTQWTKFHLSASKKAISSSPSDIEEEVSFNAATNQSIVFMSEPFSQETEITGPLAAKLYVSSSTTDADLFLTFQAFSPEGKEVEFQGAWDPHTPLSQGWLRASHRKLDTKLSKPYRPYHTHDELQPLEPGAIYELDVEIWPTHIILPAGFQIAIRISGRDFIRPDAQGSTLPGPDKGSGPFIHNHPMDRGSDVFAGKTTLHTGGSTGSYLLLPIIPT